ncbi:MAG: AI-2E family transporter, partial [Alphaproteobacteria bacterium]|nr:AI-2E family transporter [Alphaproteobacteria bacterium]
CLDRNKESGWIMTRRDRRLFWLGLLIAGLVALFTLSEVLLPFVAGMAIAYFLDPVVDRFEKIGWSRTLGASIVLVGFLITAVGLFLLLVPVLNAQLLRLIDVVPSIMERLEPVLRPVLAQLNAGADEAALGKIPSMAGEAVKWAGGLVARLVSGGIAVANLLSLILITPVVAFYLLRDWDRMVETIDGWLPRAQSETIRAQSAAIDRTLAAFVRGQGSVCIVLSIFYAAALSLAGLQFGVVIGIFVGLISFVPFVGAIVGGLLSIGLATIQFDTWQPVAIIAGIFVIGQVLEGNVLTPKLVGGAVGLHPVWVIFALLAGGALFGFVGILLALPAAAVTGVLTRFGLAKYLVSALHLHGIPPPDDIDIKAKDQSDAGTGS